MNLTGNLKMRLNAYCILYAQFDDQTYRPVFADWQERRPREGGKTRTRRSGGTGTLKLGGTVNAKNRS
ncbi:hypothetical protein J6590_025602 [Homalodisca vitripennis]|nr:hypothetical protein J6590_025602 [Homalodisca vitripennis]